VISLVNCSEIPTEYIKLVRTEYVYQDVTNDIIIYRDSTPDIVTVYRDLTYDVIQYVEVTNDVIVEKVVEIEKIVEVEKIVYIEVIKEVELMGGETIVNIDGKIYLFQNETFDYLIDGETLFYYDDKHFVTNNVCVNIETLQPIKEYEGQIINFKKWGDNEYYQIDQNIYLNGVIIGDTRGQDLQFHNGYGNSYDFFVFPDGTYATHDHRGYDYFGTYVMQWNPISSVTNPTWYSNGEFSMTSNTIPQTAFEKSFRNDGIETDNYIYMLSGAIIDKRNKKVNTFYYDVAARLWMKGNASSLFELNTQGNLYVNYGTVLGRTDDGLHVFSLGSQPWEASRVGLYGYHTINDTVINIKELDKSIKIHGAVMIDNTIMYSYNGDIMLIDINTKEEKIIKSGNNLKGFVL